MYDLIETLFSFNYVKIKNEKPSSIELVFAARDIPPFGFKIYHIQRTKKVKITNKTRVSKVTSFEMDLVTNLIKSVTLNGVSINVSQNFHFYQSNDGYSDASEVASGAYIFR